MAKKVRDLRRMNEDEARMPTVSDPKEYALGVVNRVPAQQPCRQDAPLLGEGGLRHNRVEGQP